MAVRRIAIVTAGLSLSAVLLAGCGLFGPESETTSIDPPPLTGIQTDEMANTGSGPDVDGTAKEEAKKAVADRTVYVRDANGYIVPVSLSLPKEEGVAKQVLSYMVKGGPVESMLPQGFSAVLPEGTRVLGMVIKEGVATVDFSPEFRNYQKQDEERIVEAITRSLTEFKDVKSVNIWVNGTPLTQMPMDQTPVTSLGRNKGVNVELAEHAVPGQTTSVTVYFQGQLNDERSYFVPVTRLIPETDNVAKAVVEELIKGPKEGTALFSSLLSTTKVLDVQQKEDTVVVNLSNDVLKYDGGKEASPDAMEALVLSLTENTGANKVQVLVEGKPLTQAGSFDFSKPVVRPVQINSMSF